MLYLDLLPNSIRRIQEMDVRVCVIGVGTIGLPLATFLAKAGFQVTGLDIDQKRIDEINSAKVVYEYTDILDDVVLKSKKLHHVLYDQFLATQRVFKNKNIPFRSFIIEKRDESTLGILFTYFMLETILLGKALNLNPYDQPAVELIKKETKKLL